MHLNWRQNTWIAKRNKIFCSLLLEDGINKWVNKVRCYWLLSFKTSTFSCRYPRLAKESASFKYISFLKEKNGVKGEILIKMKEEHDGGNMKGSKATETESRSLVRRHTQRIRCVLGWRCCEASRYITSYVLKESW